RDFHVTGVQTCALPICREIRVGGGDEFIVAGRHFVPGSRGLGGGCGVTWRSGGFFVFCHGALPLDRRDCGRKRYGDGRLMVRRRMLLLHPFRPGWTGKGTPRAIHLKPAIDVTSLGRSFHVCLVESHSTRTATS